MKEAMVLAGHNLVYFGPGKWNGIWRNLHQLMSRLVPQNRVIYVEPIFSIHKLCKQLRQGYRGISEICMMPGMQESQRQRIIFTFITAQPIFSFTDVFLYKIT